MRGTIQYIKTELTGLYTETETEGLIRLIFEAVCGWSFTMQQIRKSEIIGPEELDKIKSIVARLKQFEPIQYILGETYFFGLQLKVTPTVLIPRPETEELVDLIIRGNSDGNLTILDIGTGSGCIAIALKSRLNKAEISGIDISEKALKIARKNGTLNRLNVQFFQADILNWQKYDWPFFDVIVSNPPYVTKSEKELMHKNVLDFEPSNALFVNDTDPLLFYRTIAQFALEKLNPNGKIYFEINENFGPETKSLLAGFGFTEVDIVTDIHGKNRFVKAIRQVL
ncbi:MAG: peptide chain release factor N(5)-glutamine methyltransferase [Draconibacterium sp.]